MLNDCLLKIGKQLSSAEREDLETKFKAHLGDKDEYTAALATLSDYHKSIFDEVNTLRGQVKLQPVDYTPVQTPAAPQQQQAYGQLQGGVEDPDQVTPVPPEDNKVPTLGTVQVDPKWSDEEKVRFAANQVLVGRDTPTGKITPEDIDRWIEGTKARLGEDPNALVQGDKTSSIFNIYPNMLDQIYEFKKKTPDQLEEEAKQRVIAAPTEEQLRQTAVEQLTAEKKEANYSAMTRRGETPALEPTEEEIQTRVAELKNAEPTQEQKSTNYDIAQARPSFVRGAYGAAGSAITKAGGLLSPVLGQGNPVSKFGLAAERIPGYANKGEGAKDALENVGEFLGALGPQLGELAIMPGGAVTKFAGLHALHSAGSGENLAKITESAGVGGSSGAAFEAAGAFKNPLAKLGTVFGGSAVVNAASGLSLEENVKSAIVNTLFEAQGTYGPRIAGKFFRFWHGGESLTVGVTPEGDVIVPKKQDEIKTENEVVLDPKNEVYSAKVPETVPASALQRQERAETQTPEAPAAKAEEGPTTRVFGQSLRNPHSSGAVFVSEEPTTGPRRQATYDLPELKTLNVKDAEVPDLINEFETTPEGKASFIEGHAEDPDAFFTDPDTSWVEFLKSKGYEATQIGDRIAVLDPSKLRKPPKEPTQPQALPLTSPEENARKIEEAKQARQVAVNASGESSASQEAINRVSSENRQNLRRVVVDTRKPNAEPRPLFGPDAVDYTPQPYESVEFRGGDRNGEVIAQGNKVSPRYSPPEREIAAPPGVPAAALRTQETSERAYGKQNKAVTEEEAKAARELISKIFNSPTFRAGIPLEPDLLKAATKLAAYHIEAGARSFADFSKKMIQDLGEHIRPYLKQIYKSKPEFLEGLSGVENIDKTPGFFSTVESKIEHDMPSIASAEQIKGLLKDTPKEERDWLGLDEFLADNPKVSKDKLLEFIRQNQVELQEVEKNPSTKRERDATDFIWEPADLGPYGHGWAMRGIDPDEVQIRKNERGTYDIYAGGILDDEPYYSNVPTLHSAQDIAESIWRDHAEDELNETDSYQQYSLPGADPGSYRELLLKLPIKKPELKRIEKLPDNYLVKKFEGESNWRLIDKNSNDGPVIGNPTDSEGVARQKAVDYINQGYIREFNKEGSAKTFESSHWPDDPNVLVHARYDTRDNGKTLHVAEIQSDWHQAGRKKGYKGEGRKYEVKKLEKGDPGYNEYNPYVVIDPQAPSTIDPQTDIPMNIVSVHAGLPEAQRASGTSSGEVPDAPFKKSWHELAMKRIIRHAVENGFERVTWDTGETNADRYSLARDVKSIDYRRIINNHAVNIHLSNGTGIKLIVQRDGNVVANDHPTLNGKPLTDIVGREIAEKITSGEDKGTIKGEGLKVGGEGMKGFYDKILPEFVNKYVKKWGGKVENSTLGEAAVDDWWANNRPSLQQVFNNTGLPEKVQEEYTRSGAREKADRLIEDYVNQTKNHPYAVVDSNGDVERTFTSKAAANGFIKTDPDEYSLKIRGGGYEVIDVGDNDMVMSAHGTEAEALRAAERLSDETMDEYEVRHSVKASGPKVHELKITPGMQESIKGEGQPLYGSSNQIVSVDRAQKAQAVLRKKLSEVKFNAGIPLDPAVLRAAVELGAFHAEAGARKFAEWSAKMIADVGEQIKPHLEQIYREVRGLHGFEGMEKIVKPSRLEEIRPQTPEQIQVTGLKKSIDEAERGVMDVPDAPEVNPHTWEEAKVEAAKRLQKDPNAGRKLVAQLQKKARPLSDTESAVLLHYKRTVDNDYNSTITAVNAAFDKGDQTALNENQARLSLLSDERQAIMNAGRISGTEKGRALNIQKILMNEDFSLASLEGRKRAANGGRQLTNDERTHLQDIASRFAAKNAELEKKLADADAKTQLPNRRILEVAEGIVKKIDARAEQARARLRSRGATFTTGLDPEALKDLAEIGASHIANFGLDLARFTDEMVREFGDKIKPHVRQIYDAASNLIDNHERNRGTRGPISEDARLKGFKTRTNKRIEELKTKLENKDFSKRVQRPPVLLDQEATKLKVELERIKRDYDYELRKDQQKQKPRREKVQDFMARWVRAGMLSYPTTLGKLANAAAARMILNPVEETLKAGIAKAAGINDIPLPSVKAEAAAITRFFTKGLKDSYEMFRNRPSELDVLFGKDRYDHGVLEWFGMLHGMMKAPVKRASFERQFTKEVEFGIKNGEDVSNPLVQMRYAHSAYEAANRDIFMQNNTVASLYKTLLQRLEAKNPNTNKVPTGRKVGATVLRTLFPIVKIPLNFINETTQYAVGTATGSYKLGQAFSKGMENVSREEKEIILRHLSKGLLGTGGMLLGFFNPHAAGGFYQKGDKRDPSDVKAGQFRIFGMDIPRYLSHVPLLETIQMGATMRRTMDNLLAVQGKKAAKGKEEPVTDTDKALALTSGAKAAALGLIEETPFVRQTLDLAKLFDPKENDTFVDEFIKSRIVPGAVQWTANKFDQDANGQTISRKPRNIIEHIESALPGLRQNVPTKAESKDIERSTTDDVVDLIKVLRATNKSAAGAEKTLRQKATSARTRGTLTDAEVDRIKEVLPDFNITPSEPKKELKKLNRLADAP